MFSNGFDLLKTHLWMLFLFYLGVFSLSNHLIYFLKWITVKFIRLPKDLKISYGSWAIITGSTDGIGKAFAFHLAKKGLNLVLVSRSNHKLKRVSSEIRALYPDTKIRIVEMDFSTGYMKNGVVRKIEEAINGLDVGVLINNVGVTYPAARFFHEVAEEDWMKVVRVNLESTTFVTKAILPGMLRRRRGAIVNIGSGASIVVPSHPLYAIYAATKSYIDQLSRSLYVEYSRYGIDVQCQVPLYVSTKMASKVALIEKSSVFVPSAEDYVAEAVGQIGYEARCMPYWSHSVQWFFASLIPEAVLDSWRFSIGIQRRQICMPQT